MQRLSKPHIIAQKTAESAFDRRIEPLKAFFLIRTERCPQTIRHRRIRLPKERIRARSAVFHHGISGQYALDHVIDVRPLILQTFKQTGGILRIDEHITIVEFHQTGASLHQLTEGFYTDNRVAEHNAAVILQ